MHAGKIGGQWVEGRVARATKPCFAQGFKDKTVTRPRSGSSFPADVAAEIFGGAASATIAVFSVNAAPWQPPEIQGFMIDGGTFAEYFGAG